MAFQIIGSIKYDYTHRITPRKIENQPKDIKIIRHRKNQTSNIDLINTKRLLMKCYFPILVEVIADIQLII